jgi:phosphoribosylformimino-5-aminoimidazole carboxamide ribotide isomerase
MIIIPAIDIIDKKVVRLEQGEFGKMKVYAENPVAMAELWQKRGAKLLHIVDLEGARLGKPVNTDVINEIIKNIKLPVEVGGGLRNDKDMDTLFNIGANYAVVGTSGLKDEAFCRRMVTKYGEKIVFAVDVKHGKVAIRGWKEVSETDAAQYIKKIQDFGAKRIIYTDISGDGMMTGPNLEVLKTVLSSTSLEVTASGGVASIEDIKALKELEQDGLHSVIVGKALYEGKLDLGEAIKEAERAG